MRLKPLQENVPLCSAIELAFAKAKKRFPYWTTDLDGLTPVYVEISEEEQEFKWFSFAVTKGGTMLVSDMLLRIGWTPEAVATVIVHELMHLWQRHAKRAEELGVNFDDPAQLEAWRIGTDCEINDDLEDAGCVFPVDENNKRMGILPQDYGWPKFETAEEYYRRYLAENQPQPKGGQAFQQGSCGGGQGPKTSVEKVLAQELDRDESGGGVNEDKPEDGEKPESGDKPAPDVLAAGWDKTDEEMEQILEAMTDGLLAAEGKKPGSTPAGLRRDAEARRKSTVDWRAKLGSVIRRSVEAVRGTKNVNWSRPNRRMLGQFIRPTHTDPTIRITLALDTSGSMHAVMGDAIAQIESILRAANAGLTYIQCDCEIAKVIEVKTLAEAMNAGINGWGGTDFRPVFEMVDALPKRKQPDVLIFLTDGEGPAPKTPPAYRTIWAVVGDSPAPVSWGVEVRIPSGG